jgi:hypothetical protein
VSAPLLFLGQDPHTREGLPPCYSAELDRCLAHEPNASRVDVPECRPFLPWVAQSKTQNDLDSIPYCSEPPLAGIPVVPVVASAALGLIVGALVF